MKSKLSIFLLVIIYVLATAVTVLANEPLKAETTFGTAVIDGQNTDGEWDEVPEYPINKFKTGVKKDESFKASFKVKFDGQYLYVFIDVKDTTVSKRPGGVVNNGQDRITTYIDYSNAGQGDYNDPYLKQYQVTTNRFGDVGQYDCAPYDLDNNIEYKIADTNTGYTTEYKLNLEGITKEKVTADKVIGFDIQVSDMDTNSNSVRLGAYGWNDENDKAWYDTSALGKLTLKVAAQQEESPEPSDDPEPTPSEENTEEPSGEETEEPDTDETTSASPETTTTATPGDEKEGTEFPWGILIIVLVGLAAVGAGVYFFVVKKK